MKEDLQSIAFRLAGIMRDLQSVIERLERQTPRTPIVPNPSSTGNQFFNALTADDSNPEMSRSALIRFMDCPHN